MGSEIDLAVLVLSALLFGVLSGAQAALEALSYRPSEKEADDEDEETRFMNRLTGNPVYQYLALGAGRVFVVALVVVLASRFAAARLFEGRLFTPGLWIFVVLILLVPLFFARALALRDPEKYLERTKYASYPIVYLMWPVAYVLVGALKRVSGRALDVVAFPIIPFKRRIELFGHKNGAEETDEQQLVSSAFDFAETRVREVMIPRIDMVAVNVDTPSPQVADLVVESGHSRLPVYRDSIDRIVGILHAKDLLARVMTDHETSIEDVMRDAYFVPESKKIGDLLAEFKKRRIHIAIAVDEYGGTAGLVTLEDVLEELVGDIQDEFDAEEDLVRTLDGDTAMCSARIRLDEFDEIFGVDLREGDADTLGGFLYESIGRVPRVGESFASRGLEFRIESVVGQRIDKVRVKGLSSAARKTEGANG